MWCLSSFWLYGYQWSVWYRSEKKGGELRSDRKSAAKWVKNNLRHFEACSGTPHWCAVWNASSKLVCSVYKQSDRTWLNYFCTSQIAKCYFFYFCFSTHMEGPVNCFVYELYMLEGMIVNVIHLYIRLSSPTTLSFMFLLQILHSWQYTIHCTLAWWKMNRQISSVV